MKTSQLHYELPPDRIASHPCKIRRHCRLLRLDRVTGAISHHRFDELPHLLAPKDLLVINDTAVIPARLLGERSPSGGEAEIFLLEKLGARRWRAMVRPGKRLRPGAIVTFGAKSPFRAEIEAVNEDGTRMVVFAGRGRFDEWLTEFGAMPLPPYIDRPAEPRDRREYQTIFARREGAVAAPTAGLHFDPPLIERLKKSGVAIAPLTLHVGAGTFRPIRTAKVEDHKLEAEWYRIGIQTQRQILACKRLAHGRVIAVGTTVTRTLEYQPIKPTAKNRPLHALEGRADILIAPGHQFRCVDGLTTNFHLPGSSLLALVAALAGLDSVMNAYEIAIAEGYRFYSYGDAMLIL